MEKRQQIEIAIRAAQTAKSVLDILTCSSRTLSLLMLKQMDSDMEGLKKAVKDAYQ